MTVVRAQETCAKWRCRGFCLRETRLLLCDLRSGSRLPQNRGEDGRPRAAQQAPPLGLLAQLPAR
jgi:hypothetical protein